MLVNGILLSTVAPLATAYSIASLGSSYAAGPGISPMVGPSVASRSGNNYAHLLTAALQNETNTPITLNDVSVSGATLSNILNVSQSGLPPQIKNLTGSEDLLLVLGGGNDVGYVASLMSDSNAVVNVQNLTNKYAGVLDALHAVSPKAKIIVVSYLVTLGSDVIPKGETGANVPFNASRVAYHQNQFQGLRNATVAAVEGRQAWAQVLDVTDASWEHGVGSAKPWATGASSSVPWHPVLAGHQAVASMLLPRVKALMGQ